MKKLLTAEMLLNQLLEMQSLNYDLSRIELSFRYDPDSDYKPITYVGEGCFDAETNSVLEELVFMTDASEYEDVE